MPADLGRPIRVVVFCGGPRLSRAVVHFVARLEQHPEIELVGGYCQSPGSDLAAVFRDRWRRRRALALPLLAAEISSVAARWLRDPLGEWRLRQQAIQIRHTIVFVPNLHAPEILADVRARQPDLGLIYGSPILRPALFQIPSLGTLGIHHGTVPHYRGKKTTFWAMFNGEQRTGVTIQHVTVGLDAGDVVERGEVDIGHKTLASVWKEVEQLGFELYIQAILGVKRGTAHFAPQQRMRGTLFRDPSAAELIRFLFRTSMQRLLVNGRVSGYRSGGGAHAE